NHGGDPGSDELRWKWFLRRRLLCSRGAALFARKLGGRFASHALFLCLLAPGLLDAFAIDPRLLEPLFFALRFRLPLSLSRLFLALGLLDAFAFDPCLLPLRFLLLPLLL